MELLFGMLPFVLIQLAFAVVVFWMAPKIKASRIIWTIVCVVPVVGMFTFYIFLFKWMGYITDTLNLLARQND